MTMLTNIIQYLVRKNKKFLGRRNEYIGSRKKIKKVASTSRKLDTSLLIVLTSRRRNLKKIPRNQASSPTS